MNKMYAALGPNVFVKEIKRETQIGGFIVPDSIDDDFTFGEVVSCSEGYFDKGTFVPMNVAIGDKVAFPKISGTKINFNNTKMIKVHAADIIAKEVEARIVEDTDDANNLV